MMMMLVVISLVRVNAHISMLSDTAASVSMNTAIVTLLLSFFSIEYHYNTSNVAVVVVTSGSSHPRRRSVQRSVSQGIVFCAKGIGSLAFLGGNKILKALMPCTYSPKSMLAGIG